MERKVDPIRNEPTAAAAHLLIELFRTTARLCDRLRKSTPQTPGQNTTERDRILEHYRALQSTTEHYRETESMTERRAKDQTP